MPRWIFLIALVVPVFAQTGALRGRVTDESGAIVPRASVALNGPGGARSAAADESGAYAFSGLASGNYTVQASAPGLSQTPVRVAVRDGARTLDLVLRVASMQEKVTVQENGGPTVSVDAANNASALVISGADLDALADNPDDLAADLAALAGPSAGPSGGSIFVDGFSGGELPPKQSIREIRINQNPFSPEYDKLGYGKIEIFTKPGSDKYRGTVSWNFANDFWNSRNPYAPEKAPFLLNEFEGNAGGPLGKRASFTVDAQRNMVDNGSIYNTVTVNPQSLALEPLAGAFTTPGRFTLVSPRVDYQLNERNTLTFRYGITHSDVRDNGIGGFNLVSRGYHSQFTNQTVQASDTLVLGTTINETRFQYYRSATQAIANTDGAAIQVLGSFNGGGSTVGRTFDTQNSYEFQNYTSTLHKTHALRFGVRLRGQTDASTSPQNFNGTFTFGGGKLEPVLDAANQPTGAVAPITSIERYRRTLLFEGLKYTPAQMQALGGGATQFSMNAGQAGLSAGQADAGLFFGDEWKARPNVTVSVGLRYELQTNLRDRGNLAPRLAVAWAPQKKMVLRAGFGMFYDRFGLSNILTAERFNGVVEQQYVVANPTFFPSVPAPAALAGFQSTQIVEKISAAVRAPYLVQSALTLERQLPHSTTLAVTYTNSHGLHMLRSEALNVPAAPVFLMESSGLYNQNQVMANVNAKLNAGLSLFGFYVYNRAMSNTDGINTFPANPRDWSGEYGPAFTDVHHRVTAGGSINLRWNVRIAPYATVQSGAPFDITSGNDPYGTTLFNARPAFAADPNKPGLVRTSYGLLDPNPTPGERLLPRNYGRGPGQVSMNLRISKTIGLGAERGGGSAQSGGAVAPTVQAASGRGLGGLIGSPSTSHRFNLSIGLSIRNLLNHTNAGSITGNITSPYFGFANQIASSPNGEGFYENANNRRLESQIRLTF
jgi:hypothetical protein